MYTIDDILELIKNNPEEKYIQLKDTIYLMFAEVVYCHGYDELIDKLDEAMCEDWLPKYDCCYDIYGFRGADFYYGDLGFEVSITIDVEQFLNEYREE